VHTGWRLTCTALRKAAGHLSGELFYAIKESATVNLANKIVMRPVASLVPYASNSRTHTPAQLDKLARSLREFGFTNPILLDGENGIIAGHARLQAAQKIGLAEVPTIDLSWLTPTQRQAYVIADNQLATDAGWDAEMLRLELGDLKELGFDLTLTGFDEVQLGSFLADKTVGLTDPDAAPALPEHPVTEPGDLWLLGRHRLLCGDSTVATDVERVLGGVAPHLMVTDPPYGVNYDPAWRNRAAADGNIGQKKASRAVGEVANDDRADWREAWALFPGDVAYVWHAGTKAAIVQESLEACCLLVRTQIIWAKNNFAIGRGHYRDADPEPAARDGRESARRRRDLLRQDADGLERDERPSTRGDEWRPNRGVNCPRTYRPAHRSSCCRHRSEPRS
jgi:hypothetical protein